MRALGVDLSLASCGLAVVENSSLLFVATAKPPRSLESVGRREFILQRVKALQDKFSTGVIVMEEARLFTGGVNVALASIAAIISLSTTIEDWAHKEAITVIKVHTNSWRKVVLGSGRAQKADAIAYVTKHYGKTLRDDAAEAACLARYGLMKWEH